MNKNTMTEKKFWMVLRAFAGTETPAIVRDGQGTIQVGRIIVAEDGKSARFVGDPGSKDLIAGPTIVGYLID